MKGSFHAPELDPEFFPGQYYGDILFDDVLGGWFALDRIMLVRLLMTAILVLLFIAAFRNPKLVPKGLQNVAEYALDFVRIHIAEDILGKKEGRRFLPLLATIFFGALFWNVSTIIPALNISANARIGMPIVMAAAAYIAMIYAGSKRYGFGKFVKSSVVIPNLPPFLHILVVPIEIFSTFILRPVTLAIRLMANFLAGHIILVLLYSATNFFFWQLNGWSLMSGVTLLAAVLFTVYGDHHHLPAGIHLCSADGGVHRVVTSRRLALKARTTRPCNKPQLQTNTDFARKKDWRRIFERERLS